MTVTFHPLPPTAQCIPELGKSALKSKTNNCKTDNYKNKQILKRKKKKKKKECIDKANSDLTMAEVYYVQVL